MLWKWIVRSKIGGREIVEGFLFRICVVLFKRIDLERRDGNIKKVNLNEVFFIK